MRGNANSLRVLPPAATDAQGGAVGCSPSPGLEGEGAGAAPGMADMAPAPDPRVPTVPGFTFTEVALALRCRTLTDELTALGTVLADQLRLIDKQQALLERMLALTGQPPAAPAPPRILN